MPFFDSGARLRDSVILTAGRLVTGIGAAVSTRLLTQFVGPGELGRYYLLLAVSGIFSLILFAPVQSYVGRSCLRWREDGSGRVHLIAIMSIWVAATVVTAAGLVAYSLIFHGPAGWLAMAAGLPILVFAETTVGCGSLIANFLGRRLLFVVIVGGQTWGPAVAAVGCVLLFGANAESILVGRVVTLVVLAVWVAGSVWRAYGRAPASAPKAPMRVDWADMWRFIWPIALIQIFFWAQLQGYRVPIGERGGTAVLGVFSAWSAVVVGLFGFFDSVFNQLYAPIFWGGVTANGPSAIKEEVEKYLQRHWSSLTVFWCWLVGVLPFAERLLLGPEYRGYQWLGTLFAVSELARQSGTGASYGLQAANRNSTMLVPAIASFTIVMVGIYVFAAIFNPLAVGALALIGAYLVSCGIVIVRAERLFAFRLPGREMVSSAVIGGALLLLLTLARRWTPADAVPASIVVICASGVTLLGAFYLMSRWPGRQPVTVANG